MRTRSRLQTLDSRLKTRGYTIIELAVVMAIISILAVSSIGAFVSMRKGQRLNMAHDKVLSTIYLARNLAVSNDAIYHIRLEPPSNGKQYISIYCFPRTADALTARPETNGPDFWSAYYTMDQNGTRPLNPVTGERFNNFKVESVLLDQGTYVGFQNPPAGGSVLAAASATSVTSQAYADPSLPSMVGQVLTMTSGLQNGKSAQIVAFDPMSGTFTLSATAPGAPFAGPLTGAPINADMFKVTPPVIYFYPDGSASQTVTLYVSDNPAWNDSNATPTSRQSTFNHGSPNLRMVRILRGGMIKAVKQL